MTDHLLIPNFNQVRPRSYSVQKSKKSRANDIQVPTLTKAGKQRKREQEANSRFDMLEEKVNAHIELAKERARQANELITKEINATSNMLEHCEIQIGDLQSKIDKVKNEAERKEHEEKLAKLQEQRVKKVLQRQ